MRIEINWAWLVPLLVTIIVAIPSLLQVALGRRGNRLAESSGQGAEALAWAGLRADWQLVQLAAGRPWAVGRTEAEQFQRVLARYRDARIARLDALDNAEHAITASGQDPDFDRAHEEIHAASEAMAPYHAAVERVLGHLGNIADRVVRGRLSVEAVYAALGHDVVRARPALRRLLAISADSDGCPASSNPEVQTWRSLNLDVINARVGWGDFLGPHRGTAARIWLLEDLLTDHAIRVGDAGFAGLLTLSEDWDEDLTDLTFLPEVWRGVRPVGRRAAWRWTWRAAGTAHRASRRRGRRPLNPRLTEVLLAVWQAQEPGPDPRWVGQLEPSDPAPTPAQPNL